MQNRIGARYLTAVSTTIGGQEDEANTEYKHLRPGMTERVTIVPGRLLTLKQVKQKLMVRSLVDTY